ERVGGGPGDPGGAARDAEVRGNVGRRQDGAGRTLRDREAGDAGIGGGRGVLALPDDWSPLRWRIAPILTITMIVLTVAFITTATMLDISRARGIYQDELRSRGRSLSAQMSDL